jgi:hypothetical protein
VPVVPPAALTPLARRYRGAADIVTATPGSLSAAVLEMVERRRAGLRAELALDVEEPRVALMRTVAAQFLAAATPDERAARFDMLAKGQLNVSGAAQDAAEAAWYGADAVVPFQHACAIADRVVFRSAVERERCRRLFGEHPARSVTGVPPDDRVPPPPLHAPAREAHVALWVADVAPALIDVAVAMLWDLRSPLRVVDAAAPDAAAILSSARTIVALDPSDPAAAIALARYGVPLCAPWTSGAEEYVDGIHGYEPWSRAGIADAVLRATGGPPPRALRSDPAPPRPQSVAVRERAPLVSIVMPTWNRPHVLRTALSDLRAQTYPNVEVIVVNNAGLPVGDVVAEFPGTQLIDRDVNSGNPTLPRNDGFARSRGEFVTFLDDDDLFFPDHVAVNVDALERTGGACTKGDFLVRLVRREPDGSETEIGWDMERNPGITTYELLIANRIGYMAVFCRRSAIETVGAFDPKSGAEELEMWVRLASRFDFVHLDRPTTAYTIRSDWAGSATALHHHTFGDAYETFYRKHPADGLPHIAAARQQFVQQLRAQTSPPPRRPRYISTI